jgi:hypothetical protein
MASVPGAKTPATHRVACVLFAGVAALVGAESARADTYTVLVRQMDGVESVPAHMTCANNKVCRGVMSISAAGGHMRVFVIAMIDGGNAYFRFHAEERDLSCGRPRDFVHFALGPPPVAEHGYASLCDAPPSSHDQAPGPAAEPPVLKNITPPLATLRIDLRSIEKDGGR